MNPIFLTTFLLIFFSFSASSSDKLNLNKGLSAQKVDDVVYLYQNQEIKRYDTTTSSWIAPILLDNDATSFNINPYGTYVAHGNDLYFYSENSTSRELLFSAPLEIDEMVFIESYLIFITSDKTRVLNLTTQNITNEKNSSISGLVAAPLRRYVFGNKTNTIPNDILKGSLSSDGILSGFRDSPFHGDYDIGDHRFIFPDEKRIIDSTGVVYFTVDMTFSAEIEGGIKHLDFYGDLPVVLRQDSLTSYSNTFAITGSHELPQSIDTFFITDETIYTFTYENNDSITVGTVAMNVVTPEVPFSSVNPSGLTYVPHSIEYDNNNTIYILDRENLSVYPFNLNSMSYDETITLDNPPTSMRFSKANNKLYFTVANDSITVYAPETKEESLLIDENPHLNFSSNSLFEVAGEFLVIHHYLPQSRRGFSVFNSEGALVSTQDVFGNKKYIKWDPAKRIMYFYNSNATTGVINGVYLDEQGFFGEELERNQTLFFDPVLVCIKPDGSEMIQTRGDVLDTNTFEVNLRIANPITDCSWTNDTLYTFEDAGTLRLQSWSEDYVETLVTDLFVAPLGLQGLNSGAVWFMYKEFDDIPKFGIENDVIYIAGFDEID